MVALAPTSTVPPFVNVVMPPDNALVAEMTNLPVPYLCTSTPSPLMPRVEAVSVVADAVSTTNFEELGTVTPPEMMSEPPSTCTSFDEALVNVIAPLNVLAPLTLRMTPLSPPIPAPEICSALVMPPEIWSCAPLEIVVEPAVLPSALP